MNSVTTKVCRLLLLGLLCLVGGAAQAIPWYPFGPDGGDARAFAQDPRDHAHLYLGTTNGWLYQSRDNGATWARVARVAQRDDLILDHILVDPADSRHLLVGAWVAHALDTSSSDGGVFISHDGGSTWAAAAQMQGQSIRSMAVAPSDRRIVLAGSLQGVYRSTDGGDHWTRISPTEPPLSNEIHNVESLAIDPHDPNTIYAGTRHLPWKTTDGGKTWENMKQGIIDDSDVFSITVDPEKPSTVYLSACSGIYKSENTGESFVKAQGIPSDARRTRVLRQDPQDLDTIFAGTTEGLYRTQDAGAHWQAMTDPTMIVNDVYVDPVHPQHVLLAVDHGGVLVSEDGGILFRHSNSGFTQRQIVAYASDPHRQATIYLGVVNDKQDGGVFRSLNGGSTWTQMSDGLNGRDVLSLAGAPDGTMVAGTEHGIFRLAGAEWVPSGRSDVLTLQGPVAAPPVPKALPKTTAARRKAMAARAAAATPKAPASQELDDRVFALATAGNSMYAATSTGLLWSGSAGESWRHIAGVPAGEWRFVATNKSTVLAGQLKALMLSTDEGHTWKGVALPQELKLITALAVDGAGELWVGGRQGLFYSADGGASWRTVKYLDVNQVTSLFYDAGGNRLLLTADSSPTRAYQVSAGDKVLTQWDTGWHVQMLRPVLNFLVAVSQMDGIILQQPVYVDSATLPARK